MGVLSRMVGRKTRHGRVQSSNWEAGGPPGGRGASQGPAGRVRLPRFPQAPGRCAMDPLGAWMLGLDWSGLRSHRPPSTRPGRQPGPSPLPQYASSYKWGVSLII